MDKRAADRPSVRTLTERMAASRGGADASRARGDGVAGYDEHWQVPAATEKTAFDAMRAAPPRGYEYWGYAWATVIDGARGRSPKASDILSALAGAPMADGTTRRATVLQHIYALDFLDLFERCGITDLFWSHATKDEIEAAAARGGPRIHPFPLFPAQSPVLEPGTPTPERAHLANFIGAFNPKNYLSDVRERIFDLEGTNPDTLVVRRDAWHFDRAVYREQVAGQDASEQERAMEARRTAEYLDAIRSSWFTLCPTGSGPNSIRLFESLALRSIPILLTDALALPGDADLWARAAIIGEDSAAGLARSLARARDTSEAERAAMIEAGGALFAEVGPDGYRALIERGMKDAETEG